MRTAIIGIILLVQLGCSTDDFDSNSFSDDPSITTLDGTWKVISFEDLITNVTEFKTQENSWGTDIIVTFNDNLNQKTFSGKVTTNLVQGEFEYVGERQFALRYVSTFAAQPIWADKFGAAVLDQNVAFKISNEKLRIYYDNQTKSVTLVRE